MATRLNMFLTGGPAVQRRVVDIYVDFLNKGITPIVPGEGSIGEADITVISHIGLAAIGEGKVYYDGKEEEAKDALPKAGIKLIKDEIVGKDALAMLSSNAYSAAKAALALDRCRHMIDVSFHSFVTSLEALNGNVAPFLQGTLDLRPFPSIVAAGKILRKLLDGSYLWEKDDDRSLQDPLSYRTAVYLLGTMNEAYYDLYELILIQINSSDDNPGVAVNVEAPGDRYQEARPYVDDGELKGALFPTANFETLPWVISMERLAITIAHWSLSSTQPVIKLNDDSITKLEKGRFLGTPNTYHAFGAMEKPTSYLAMKNKQLAFPVSMDYFALAGGVEDVATNAPEVAVRLTEQIDNVYRLLGIELIHAAQALDLRTQQSGTFAMSEASSGIYGAIRDVVDFLDFDRPMAPDFAAAAETLRVYSVPSATVIDEDAVERKKDDVEEGVEEGGSGSEGCGEGRKSKGRGKGRRRATALRGVRGP